jgi:hypothetical protein
VHRWRCLALRCKQIVHVWWRFVICFATPESQTLDICHPSGKSRHGRQALTMAHFQSGNEEQRHHARGVGNLGVPRQKIAGWADIAVGNQSQDICNRFREPSCRLHRASSRHPETWLMQGMQGPRGDGGLSGVLTSSGQLTTSTQQLMCLLDAVPRIQGQVSETFRSGSRTT